MFWFDFTFIDYIIACIVTQKKFTSTWRSSTRKNEKLVNLTNGAFKQLDKEIKILDEVKKRCKFQSH